MIRHCSTLFVLLFCTHFYQIATTSGHLKEMFIYVLLISKSGIATYNLNI